MSGNSSKIPSNDEVIEDLTKDLSASSKSPTHSENTAKEYSEFVVDDFQDLHLDETSDDEKYKTTEEVIDEASSTLNDESKDPELSNEKASDYIDEELLKTQEESLSEHELISRYNKALELKSQGNSEYKNNEYLASMQTYTEALKLCPLKYANDRAIFYSNRAAAKISLERTKSALDDCSKAIEYNPNYVRAYLRRAKLLEQNDKLDESYEDYKKILELDPGNNEALAASTRLPPLIQERNEKLKEEMLGKLKDLGNLILKPFGLSTNNFNVQQDPKSGGYSVNFKQ